MTPWIRRSVPLALLLSAGCARSARVESAHLAEAGTHVVATPGALTVVQRDATPRSCTLRVAAPRGKGKKDGAHAGKSQSKRAGRAYGHGGGGAHSKVHGGGAPGAGPAAALDVLLFRLCEARANGDLTAEQYAASVQTVLKAMAEMATRPPMMSGGPGMMMGGERMPRGGPGMRPRRGFFGPRPRPDGDDDDEQPSEPPPADAPAKPPPKPGAPKK